MLQVYQVTIGFSAQRLDSIHLGVESFEVGELLVILNSDGFHTTFCRRDDEDDLESRRHFIITDEEFALWTTAT